MPGAEAVFFASLALALYVYVGYPALVGALATLASRRVRHAPFTPRISVIIAAHDEEHVIETKLLNALALDYPAHRLEIIVASDGSSDRTDEVVEGFAGRGVLLCRAGRRVGKTSAQQRAVAVSSGDVLLFSDANSIWAPDAVSKLVRNFADPEVGCVSGRLVYVEGEPSATGLGCRSYWGYETFVRSCESRIGALVGASGCLYGVRRSSFVRLAPDLIDDFAMALEVRSQGLRTVFEPEAVAFESTNRVGGRELRMRTRVVEQSLHVLAHYRRLLDPRRHGLFAVQLASHKLLRYLVPIALLATLLSNTLLARAGGAYALALLGQMGFYTLAAAGAVGRGRGGRARGWLAAPYYFVLANAAAGLALVRFVRGDVRVTWAPARGPELPGGLEGVVVGAPARGEGRRRGDRLGEPWLRSFVARHRTAWLDEPYAVAYVCLLLFTLLLFVRPDDLWPEAFASLPLREGLAALAVAAWALPALRGAPRAAGAPPEAAATAAMLLLGALHLAVAKSPSRSLELLADILKVAAVFGLAVAVVRSHARLRALAALLAFVAAVYAAATWLNLLRGQLTLRGWRVEGLPGIFSNPNDVAVIIAIGLPLATVLAIDSRRLARTIYGAGAAVMVAGVISTYSRAGFLATAAGVSVLFWRLSGGRRALILAGPVFALILLTLAPAGYRDRMATIVSPQSDPKGSAQERLETLDRAVGDVLGSPLVGAGIGGFDLGLPTPGNAHNSLLQVTLELGVAGLLAYLVVIVSMVSGLWRVERATSGPWQSRERDERRSMHLLSVGLLGSAVALVVASMFGSYQFSWMTYYTVAMAVCLRSVAAAGAPVAAEGGR